LNCGLKDVGQGGFFSRKVDITQTKMIASQERTIAKMNVWLAEMKDGRKDTTVYQEAVEAYLEKMEANPEEVKFEAESKKVPKEEAAMKSFGELKKRHRGQHLTAGCRGNSEESNKGKLWVPEEAGFRPQGRLLSHANP
jgi:hypothetical protein